MRSRADAAAATMPSLQGTCVSVSDAASHPGGTAVQTLCAPTCCGDAWSGAVPWSLTALGFSPTSGGGRRRRDR
jgi:hypothetical protein